MFKRFLVLTALITAAVLAFGVTAYAGLGASLFPEAHMQDAPPEFDEWWGYYFEPKVDLTIGALGRPGEGMQQEHRMLVWEASITAADAREDGSRLNWDADRHEAWIVADVTIKPGSPDENGFKYETLPAPLTLKAGTIYMIVSLEYAGGDPVMSKGNLMMNPDNMTDFYDSSMVYIWGSARSGNGIIGTAANPAPPHQPDGSVSNNPIYVCMTFWLYEEDPAPEPEPVVEAEEEAPAEETESAPEESAPPAPSNPKTGENYAVYAAFIAALLAGAGFVMVNGKRRKAGN